MAPKVDPRDWDRLFRTNAPRRGGPLRALANLLLTLVVFILLGGAALLGSRGLERARELSAQTQVAIATNNAAIFAARTTTAAAAASGATATAAALAAATPTAAPETLIGRGSVLNGGYIRSAPDLIPETVIGQVCPGDQIDFIEQTTLANGALWYRIRITQSGPNCSNQQVSVGTPGWVSATLLSEPGP